MVDLAAGRIEVTNLYDFVDLSNISLSWRVERDGEPIAAGELAPIPIPPRQARVVTIPWSPLNAGEARFFLLVEYRVLVVAAPWAEKNHVLGFTQLELPVARAGRNGRRLRACPGRQWNASVGR